MTDASFFGTAPARAAEPVKDIPLPTPQPFAPPVFIHDCVTPLGGETLLSLLMKRMMAEKDQP